MNGADPYGVGVELVFPDSQNADINNESGDAGGLRFRSAYVAPWLFGRPAPNLEDSAQLGRDWHMWEAFTVPVTVMPYMAGVDLGGRGGFESDPASGQVDPFYAPFAGPYGS